MPQIKEICAILDAWAPPAYAESYDNPGLLVGDPEAEVKGVLVSLDCTEEVIAEAIDKGCNLVISHHPILFKGLKRLTGRTYVERTVMKAVSEGVALYAIHTNLDAVSTGVNHKIADLLSLSEQTILRPKRGALSKLTVFVPRDDASSLREGLFAAGAGVIGNYSGCSFNLDGHGTFHPEEGAKPTIGAIGETQHEEETRVEIMFPTYRTTKVLGAMREHHPYEEVAYYLHQLENENQYVGSGMVANLSEAMRADEFLSYLKERLDLRVVRHTAVSSESIRRVAVSGGSGSFLLSDAIRAGADAFVTADFKYHEFFDAEGKIMIADIGHYESERFTIDLIADYLREKFTTFAIRLTEVNTNPIHYYF
jgi:dinuclear metal center YbgI/SA1388 family protein